MKRVVISKMIKEFRCENDMTQEQFGKLLAISPQAVSKWEREECYPDITFLPDIAKLLGCSVEDFFENG